MNTIDQLADDLMYRATNYHRLTGSNRGPVLCKLSELPEMTPAQQAAWDAVRKLGQRLADDGVMAEVFDSAIERHGHRAVRCVNAAWDGIGGWKA